ncbi:hypothetical protein ACQ9BO_09960 [Flavobacterium sp. P21]|uniref:hypothetical protein n=1 Tax=Flavobacterium sp. P21 TaxID=3423948 RepID=UPI003D664170
MKKLLFLAFVILCSCQSNKKENPELNLPEDPYFTKIKVNDIKLGEPVFGDWLYSHPEKGQSFEQFMNTKHVVPTKEEDIIYLQPIGQFDSLQVKQIELVRQYLEIFFQLKTKVLKEVSNDIIPKNVRKKEI